MPQETARGLAAEPRTKPPFRADHVCSLLRPARLLQVRDDSAAEAIDAAVLQGVEDEAIRDVVRKQEDAGLRAATSNRPEWATFSWMSSGPLAKVAHTT